MGINDITIYSMDTVILILVGAVAGWVASLIMRAKTSPLINILLGVVGGMLAGYLFDLVNVSLASGIPGMVIESFIGAVFLVFVYRMMSK